jgi:alkaline phosphatase D
MKKFRLMAILVALSLAACKTPALNKSTSTSAEGVDSLMIAFGSCNDVKNPNLLWDDIVAKNPSQWLWLGDNVYGSESDLNSFAVNYTKLLADTGYRQLQKVAATDGIWDDGEFGKNNGGADYIYKDSTKNMLLDFLQVPDTDSRRKRGGVYFSKTVQHKDLSVKMIFLDTRYFRDTLIYQKDSIVPNPTGDMLGTAQWEWLANELKNNPTDFTIIVSGIQVLATGHRFEKWSNFPASKEKLFQLLGQYTPQKMCFISGDRHIGEISETSIKSLPYKLVDVTSSSLTNPWSKPRPEANVYRKGQLVYPVNFGLISIRKKSGATHVTVSLEGNNGQQYTAISF